MGNDATVWYHSQQWQVLEERSAATGDVEVQYVWSPVYVDAMILRDQDTDGDGTLDERIYVTQDANFNITSIIGKDGTDWEVVERYLYDPYGERTVLNADWTVDTDGLSDFAFVHGHQGGRHYLATGLVDFRNRHLDTSLGRWERQDPAGYVDGNNTYEALGGNPVAHLDWEGLSFGEYWDGLGYMTGWWGPDADDVGPGYDPKVGGPGKFEQGARTIGGFVPGVHLVVTALEISENPDDPLVYAGVVPVGRVVKIGRIVKRADDVPTPRGNPSKPRKKPDPTGCFVAGTPVFVVANGEVATAGAVDSSDLAGSSVATERQSERELAAAALFAAGLGGYWLLRRLQHERLRQQAQKAIFAVEPIRLPLHHTA